jgi:hypothetical protein
MATTTTTSSGASRRGVFASWQRSSRLLFATLGCMTDTGRAAVFEHLLEVPYGSPVCEGDRVIVEYIRVLGQTRPHDYAKKLAPLFRKIPPVSIGGRTVTDIRHTYMSSLIYSVLRVAGGSLYTPATSEAAHEGTPLADNVLLALAPFAFPDSGALTSESRITAQQIANASLRGRAKKTIVDIVLNYPPELIPVHVFQVVQGLNHESSGVLRFLHNLRTVT